MNKVILQGRLVRDPEVRYSPDDATIALARYTLAVDRPKQGDADFINCVTFGKTAAFAERYLRKGVKITVCGSLNVNRYERDGEVRYITSVIVREHYFCESKKDGEPAHKEEPALYPIEEYIPEEDLPF